MKIMQIITRPDLGGAQTVLVNLANQLVKQHSVIVVIGKGNNRIKEILDSNIILEQINFLQRNISLKNDFLALFFLRKIYNKYSPDIIHLHSSKAGLLGRLIFPKKKIVYTVHGFDSIRLAYPIFLPLERILQYRCAAIVGVSMYDKDNLVKAGITKNVCFIYNGLEKSRPEAFSYPLEITNYKKKFYVLLEFPSRRNLIYF